MPRNPNGRPIRDEADARDLLRKIELQGSTPYSYAQDHAISASSLYRWRRILGTAEHNLPPQLVEITPTPAPSPVLTPPPKPVYELQLGDLTLRVDDHFQDHTLARLIRLLRSC